jgi:hypothetical protein
MDEPKDKEPKPGPLTEKEAAERIRKTDELLDRWCEQLSPEESVAWMDAHIEDLEADLAKLDQEKADFEAIARVMEGHESVGDAIKFIWKKEHRTLAEEEALNAFARVKDKSIRPK